jgi:hypothetical protein
MSDQPDPSAAEPDSDFGQRFPVTVGLLALTGTFQS